MFFCHSVWITFYLDSYLASKFLNVLYCGLDWIKLKKKIFKTLSLARMEADGEQNQKRASTKASGPSSQMSTINSMSLYEKQAVQVQYSFSLCTFVREREREREY